MPKRIWVLPILIGASLTLALSGCASTASNLASGSSASSSSFSPSSEAPAAQASAKAHASYQDVIDDLVSSHGTPRIVKTGGGSHVAGVAFAITADFGAGWDSLVVVYRDESRDASPSEGGTGSYVVEVWDGGPNGAEPTLVFAGSPIARDPLWDTLLFNMAGLDDGRWGLLKVQPEDGEALEGMNPIGFDASGEVIDFGRQWDKFRGKALTVPLESNDTTGYMLQLGLAQPENMLSRFGMESPLAEVNDANVLDGWYSTTVAPSGYKHVSWASAVSTVASLEGDKLVLGGTMHHAANNDDLFIEGANEMVGPVHWELELDDDVSYQYIGGANGSTEISRDELVELLPVEGMNLKFVVADGSVVMVAICS